MKVSTSRCGVDASVWGAHASRVLALAPSPARTFSTAGLSRKNGREQSSLSQDGIGRGEAPRPAREARALPRS